MRLEELHLQQFRNYGQFHSQFHPETNLIYGENAQGKTNLLEGIVFLSRGRSFRSQKDREMIQLGESFSVVEGRLHRETRDFALRIQFARNKKFWKNQVNCQSASDFSFLTVLFCPEDLSLVKEGAVLRRRFLDVAICQLRPNYALALGEYKRLYGHKTKILKEQSPNLMAALPDFNHRLAQTGAMLIHYRAHFIKRLQETMPSILLEFSGKREELQIGYHSQAQDAMAGERAIFQDLLAHQEGHYQRELASRRCLTGPHKDDILFWINGLSAKEYASQGQCRSLVLCLKLAEREIFYQETGEFPVLLMDDVLSELDGRRQEYVLNRIRNGQTFLTCCHKDSFLGLKEGGLFGISQGGLIE